MTHNAAEEERVRLATRRLIPPPVASHRIAWGLVLTFIAFIGFTLVSPWQQNIRGTGRVIAYAPLERRQNIEAPIGGRVVEWFVQEGQTVAADDPIVRLSDNDPQLMEHFQAVRAARSDRLRQAESRVGTQRSRLDAVIRSQASSVVSYQARLRAARQAVAAADQAEAGATAEFETALLNFARHRALLERGLSSERDFELAQLARTRAQTARDSARARTLAARDLLASKQAELEQARASRDSATESARASLLSSEGEVASAQAAMAQLDIQISRQEAQMVTAPRPGVIFRLVANQGGDQVSAGDTLAVLVPDAVNRAVEMWVDGNDASLISPGRAVRLQFEGWPAVQFAGWPSVAVGTFGGSVAFVDSTDDGNGNFRIVITPDPTDEPWPSTRFLRQGVRANGWVLLNRVTMGFELWRRLNGFPPVLDRPEAPAAARSPGGAR